MPLPASPPAAYQGSMPCLSIAAPMRSVGPYVRDRDPSWFSDWFVRLSDSRLACRWCNRADDRLSPPAPNRWCRVPPSLQPYVWGRLRCRSTSVQRQGPIRTLPLSLASSSVRAKHLHWCLPCYDCVTGRFVDGSDLPLPESVSSNCSFMQLERCDCTVPP